MNRWGTVAIISNVEFVTKQIESMLVLLRDVDSIQCHDFSNTQDFVKNNLPAVIILHSLHNDTDALKLIIDIKSNPETKNIPLILYPEYSTADFIIEAFDKGVNDILSAPLKDYELAMRVIWAIQKNQLVQTEKNKNTFLTKIGILDEKSGFYKEEFGVMYLESITNQLKKEDQKACLVIMRPQIINDNTAYENIIPALKSSIRVNDAIAIKENKDFFVLLSKAKLDGVYSMYERLLANLGASYSFKAAACEIQDELFDDAMNVLERYIEKKSQNGLDILKKQDFIDVYQNETDFIQQDLPITKPAEECSFLDKKPDEPDVIKKTSLDNSKIPVSNDTKITNEKIDMALQIVNHQVQKMQNEKNKRLKAKKSSSSLETVIDTEEKQADQRSAILYKQAWAKKNKLFIKPLFKKYALSFQNDFQLIADIDITENSGFLKLEKNDIKLNFKMDFDGIKNVKFDISIIALNSTIEADSFTMDVMELDAHKLNIIINTLAKEYKNYITTN